MDFMVFYPEGSQLHIEFIGTKYIACQPQTPQEMSEFMARLRPVIAQLDEYVIKHGLSEIIELNLKDVPMSKLNSDTAVSMIQLISAIRPDGSPELNLLKKIKITNSNPIFKMMYKAIKGRLPPSVVSILEIVPNSKFF